MRLRRNGEELAKGTRHVGPAQVCSARSIGRVEGRRLRGDHPRRRAGDLVRIDRGRGDSGDRCGASPRHLVQCRAARRPRRSGLHDPGRRHRAGDPEVTGRVVFPSPLERRRRIDHALFAVWGPTSPAPRCARSTTWLVPAARTPGSPSPRSRIFAHFDVEVASFADRDVAGDAFPYMALEATVY